MSGSLGRRGPGALTRFFDWPFPGSPLHSMLSSPSLLTESNTITRRPPIMYTTSDNKSKDNATPSHPAASSSVLPPLPLHSGFVDADGRTCTHPTPLHHNRLSSVDDENTVTPPSHLNSSSSTTRHPIPENKKFPRNRPDRGARISSSKEQSEFLQTFFKTQPKRDSTHYTTSTSSQVSASTRDYKTTSVAKSSLDLTALTPLTTSLLFPPPAFLNSLRSPKLLHNELQITQQHTQTSIIVTTVLSYLLSIQNATVNNLPSPSPPPNVLITGPSGSGKTYIISALLSLQKDIRI